MNNNKEFDRSVAFTFYKEWKQDADTIEEDFGSEGKAAYYDAIANYALFEIEPEMKAPIKYFWSSIKERIDASQSHRAKGFAKEDVELTQKIVQYKEEHPDASQRDIAEALDCSVGKVNKALKSASIDIPIDINIPTPIPTPTTVNVNVNAHESQTEEKEKRTYIRSLLESMNCEQLATIKEVYKSGMKYKEIAEMYSIPYFNAEEFERIYDSVHGKQYEREHAEEIAEQKALERQQWEEEEKINQHLRMIMADNTRKRNSAVV